DFDKNRFVYVYYTHQNGNRVSRFVLNEKLEDEFILLDNIPNARFHDGGRIKFGPDENLYITTGDATVPSSAQDINSLAGKILRMNKDGTIPADNPFGNYVYSYGHRNPQGLAWHTVTKELYASEHGPTKNDEINKIAEGKNYGWPNECNEISKEYVNPIRCYSEFTLAPSGIAFYKNDLYIAGLRGTHLRKIIFDKDYKTILHEEELFSDLGRIRDVVEHEGYLYIATSNRDGRGIPKLNDDRILRLKIK
ncbi:PQQ-dependent sugar dehydrogenase, partial [Candidatus Woesearchaeota archaeon]|nr:PQQ-dependent sugar dehydrogenase [Candidatus Woesearchaeota archaeon]